MDAPCSLALPCSRRGCLADVLTLVAPCPLAAALQQQPCSSSSSLAAAAAPPRATHQATPSPTAPEPTFYKNGRSEATTHHRAPHGIGRSGAPSPAPARPRRRQRRAPPKKRGRRTTRAGGAEPTPGELHPLPLGLLCLPLDGLDLPPLKRCRKVPVVVCTEALSALVTIIRSHPRQRFATLRAMRHVHWFHLLSPRFLWG